MKIALVTNSFFPIVGGAEFVVHHLAEQWSLQGHEVVVFSGIKEKIDKQLINVDIKYKVKPFSILRGTFKICPHAFPYRHYNALSIKKQLDNFRPDYISAHFGYPLGVWMSQIKPRPEYMITCHGRDLTDAEWGYRRRYNGDRALAAALNNSKAVVAISSFARRQIEALGVPANKISTISNGVDVARFSEDPGSIIRKLFDIPKEALLLLSVGRNSKDKDYSTALMAFAETLKKHPQTYYLIVGEDTEALAQLSRDLNCNERLRLSNGLFGKDLVAAYREADVFVSSSVSELCPLVVLEALASGLPLVVTNISGSQDIVENNKNGFIEEPQQPLRISQAIDLLLNNKQLRLEMAERNREKAKLFSWESISRKYLAHSIA